jgi:hypothetical protein
MSHIDTLKVYKDYLAAGYTEKQAVIAVDSLNASFDSVVTTKDLKILENDLKIFFTWEIAGVFLIAFVLPKIGKRFGWE